MNKPLYKQKLITIVTVDGRKIEMDFKNLDLPQDFKIQFPVGYDLPPDHPVYRPLIMMWATGGFTDIDRSDQEEYVHIPPSQIKSVSLRWVRDETQLLTIVD